MLRPSAAADLRSTSACRTALSSRSLPPSLERGDLLDLDRFRHGLDAFDAARRQRRRLGLGIGVDADQHLLALLDRLDAGGVGGDQRLFHVVDGRDGAAHRLELGELGAGLFLQLLDLAVDLDRAVEDVAVVEQVGLVGDDLLEPERPLLVPRPRQAERLVPGGELHGAGARLLRQRHRQHREQDAIDVVLGLLLGQPQRVHLHAVAEAAERRIVHAVALLGDLVPEIDEGAHLARLR